MSYADPNDFEPVGGGTAVADPSDFEVVTEQADPSDFEIVSPAAQVAPVSASPLAAPAVRGGSDAAVPPASGQSEYEQHVAAAEAGQAALFGPGSIVGGTLQASRLVTEGRARDLKEAEDILIQEKMSRNEGSGILGELPQIAYPGDLAPVVPQKFESSRALENAGRSFAGSAATSIPNVIGGVAGILASTGRLEKSDLAKYEQRAEELSARPSVFDGKFSDDELKQMRTAPEGYRTPQEDMELIMAREAIKKLGGSVKEGAPFQDRMEEYQRLATETAKEAQTYFGQDPKRQDEFLNKFAAGAGSLPLYIATGIAGGPVASMLTGALQTGQNEYDAAIEAGHPELADKALEKGLLIGLTEGVGVGGGLDKVAKGFASKAFVTFKKSYQEGGQEWFQNTLSNFNASTATGYDPTRPLFKGSGEAGAIGFLLGGGVEGTSQALSRTPETVPAEVPVPGAQWRGGQPLTPVQQARVEADAAKAQAVATMRASAAQAEAILPLAAAQLRETAAAIEATPIPESFAAPAAEPEVIATPAPEPITQPAEQPPEPPKPPKEAPAAAPVADVQPDEADNFIEALTGLASSAPESLSPPDAPYQSAPAPKAPVETTQAVTPSDAAGAEPSAEAVRDRVTPDRIVPPEGGTAHAPQQEGAHIVSTAVELPDGKLAVGYDFNTPHEGIGAANDPNAPAPAQNRRGFIVQREDGTQYFERNRDESAKIARAAGQTDVESNLQSTELRKRTTEPVQAPEQIQRAPVAHVTLFEQLRNATIDFNKPRASKARKAEIIASADAARKGLAAAGYTSEQMRLVEIGEHGVPLPEPSPAPVEAARPTGPASGALERTPEDTKARAQEKASSSKESWREFEEGKTYRVTRQIAVPARDSEGQLTGYYDQQTSQADIHIIKETAKFVITDKGKVSKHTLLERKILSATPSAPAAAPEPSPANAIVNEPAPADAATAEPALRIVPHGKRFKIVNAADEPMGKTRIKRKADGTKQVIPKTYETKAHAERALTKIGKRSTFGLPPSSSDNDPIDAILEQTSGKGIYLGNLAPEERAKVLTNMGIGEKGIWRNTIVGNDPYYTPDKVAQLIAADDAGNHGAGDENAMYDLIRQAITSRKSLRDKGLAQTANQKTAVKQARSFESAVLTPKEGETGTPASSLKTGDEVLVEGERLIVTDVDEDGIVTLKDGSRFGIQTVGSETAVYGEIVESQTDVLSDWPEIDTPLTPDEYSDEEGLLDESQRPDRPSPEEPKTPDAKGPEGAVESSGPGSAAAKEVAETPLEKARRVLALREQEQKDAREEGDYEMAASLGRVLPKLRKDLAALEAAPVEPVAETPAAADESKELWQVKRDQVGEQLTEHRHAVRDAVKAGLPVADDVLAEYSMWPWAGKEMKKRRTAMKQAEKAAKLAALKELVTPVEEAVVEPEAPLPTLAEGQNEADLLAADTTNTGKTANVTNEEAGTLVRVGGQVVAKLNQNAKGEFVPTLNEFGDKLTAEQKALIDNAAKDYTKTWRAAAIREGVRKPKQAADLTVQTDMLEQGLSDAPLFEKPATDKIEALLDKGIEAAKYKPGQLLLDPFLLQTFGKPVLRVALQTVKVTYLATKSTVKAIEAGLAHLRANMANFDETRAARGLRDFIEMFQAQGLFPPEATSDAMPPADEARLRSAYRAVQARDKWGFPDITIADLMAEAGITDVPEGHRLLEQLHREGKIQFGGGDASLSSPEVKKWGIKVGSDERPMLLMQFEPETETTEAETPATETPAPEGPGETVPPIPPEPTAPEPERPPMPETTAAYNEETDKLLAASGLEPIAKPASRALGEAWTQALGRTAEDAELGGRLVAELNENPRTLVDDIESGVLLVELADRKAEQAKAQAALFKAVDSKDEAAIGDAKARLENARNAVYEAITAAKATGTAWGRAGRFRQVHIDQDYSLVAMEAAWRSEVNKGEPLNEAQSKLIAELHARIDASEKKLAEFEAKEAEAEAARVFDQVLKDAKKEAASTKKNGSRILTFLNDQAAKAKARIIARRGKLFATVDPLNIAGLVDEAIIGADYIAQGITKLSDWSVKMLADFGERLKPALPELFEKSKEYHATVAAEMGAGKPAASPKEVLASAKEGEPLSQKVVFDLARAHVNAGVEGMDNVMKAVHADLLPLHEGLTEREVRDAFSGYGKVTYPSKEADLTKLREYKNLARLTSQLEDALRREAPKRTGPQRDAPTPAIRALQKQVSETMRRLGIQTTSPEQQLKTSLDAVKTRLRNQIEDLNQQIATRTKPDGKTAIPYDAEATALKTERDRLAGLAQEIFGKPEMTDAQRIAAATKALDRSIAEEDALLKAGILKRPAKESKTPLTPELESKRAMLDSMRDLRRELAAAENPKQSPEERALEAAFKAAKTSLARYDAMLKSGNLTPAERAAKFTPTGALETLWNERNAVRDAVAELRRESRPRTAPEEVARRAALKALDKRMADLDRRLKTGDFTARPVVPGKAGGFADVQAKRAEVAAMNDLYRMLKKASLPHRTPEEIQLARDKKLIANRTAELQRRLAAGDYAPKVKRPPVMDTEKARLMAENARVKNDYHRGRFEAALKDRTWLKKSLDFVTDAIGVMRLLQTSFDDSSVGRQGRPFFEAHPFLAAKTFPAHLKAAMSEKQEFEQFAKLKLMPDFDTAIQAGLKLTDPGEMSYSKMEEEYQSRWVNRSKMQAGQPARNVARKAKNVATAPLRVSQRAFNAYMNNARMQMFSALKRIHQWTGGTVNVEEMKAYANMVNVLTGRGNLGQAERAVPIANWFLYATRFYVSRVQSLIGQPFYGGTARTRAIIASEYLRIAAGRAIYYSMLGMLLGSDDDDDDGVIWDPRSSNFGSVKVNNSYINPWTGTAKYITILARLITGDKMDNKGRIVPLRGEDANSMEDIDKMLFRFAESIRSPIATLVHDMARGKQYGDRTGDRPATPQEIALDAVTPLTGRDAVALVEDNGAELGAVLWAMVFGGESISVHTKREGSVKPLK